MNFYYWEIKYRIKEARRKKSLLEKVIREENFEPGDLNYIFTRDKRIKELNRKFLGHSYPTDVLSFRMNSGKNIEGEVYISICTVKRNAKRFGTDVEKELLRVLVHGTLHLCGYEDDTSQRIEEMRRIEDLWIENYYSKSNGVLL